MRIVGELCSPLRFIDRHHQMALAEAEVEDFINVLFRFREDVLAYDADVRRTVFDIRRHVRRLRDDEANLLFLVGNDELARFLFQSLRRIADAGKKLFGQSEKLALRKSNRQVVLSVYIHQLHLNH